MRRGHQGRVIHQERVVRPDQSCVSSSKYLSLSEEESIAFCIFLMFFVLFCWDLIGNW